GIGLLTHRFARLAATALAAMLLLWVVLLYLPLVFVATAAWIGMFETFAIFGGVWILGATLPVTGPRRSWDGIVDKGPTLGRICFGISLPVFGLSHFIYHDFVASWVPKWIPFPQFWAWFTGFAHAAAGLAILANVKTRLA